MFSVCTPFTAPSTKFVSIEDLVNGPAPQFAYQIHLASGEVEQHVKFKDDIRQFLRGMYGGRGPKKEVIFNPFKGILFDNLPKIGSSPIVSDKVCGSLLI